MVAPLREPILQVSQLVVRYPLAKPHPFAQQHYYTAVDGVHLQVYPGQTLGLVGESGCGKSTTAKAIVQLIRPSSGLILFHKQDLKDLRGRELRERRRRIQMIFQDPYASLNPRHTASSIIAEPILNFDLAKRSDAIKRAEELLERVGLGGMGNRYPHEFSGGQRQRIGIARALAAEPELLICDEPVSALDVSIQAQILNLLLDLKRELDLAMLFIAHDLAVVRHIADRIAIMNQGKVVEEQDTDTLFAQPQDSYTRKLLSAIPVADPAKARAMLAEHMTDTEATGSDE